MSILRSGRLTKKKKGAPPVAVLASALIPSSQEKSGQIQSSSSPSLPSERANANCPFFRFSGVLSGFQFKNPAAYVSLQPQKKIVPCGGRYAASSSGNASRISALCCFAYSMHRGQRSAGKPSGGSRWSLLPLRVTVTPAPINHAKGCASVRGGILHSARYWFMVCCQRSPLRKSSRAKRMSCARTKTSLPTMPETSAGDFPSRRSCRARPFNLVMSFDVHTRSGILAALKCPPLGACCRW